MELPRYGAQARSGSSPPAVKCCVLCLVQVLPTRQFTAVFNSAELVLCGRLKLSVAVEDVQGMLKADSKRYTARGARRRPPSPPPGEEDAVVDVG